MKLARGQPFVVKIINLRKTKRKVTAGILKMQYIIVVGMVI